MSMMTLDALVSAQFDKVFHFSPLGDKNIGPPKVERWFGTKAAEEEDTRFARLRDDLNRTKGKLNRLPLSEWHEHTRARNPAGEVVAAVRARVRPELLTQAWCKFYECASTFPRLVARSKGVRKSADY